MIRRRDKLNKSDVWQFSLGSVMAARRLVFFPVTPFAPAQAVRRSNWHPLSSILNTREQWLVSNSSNTALTRLMCSLTFSIDIEATPLSLHAILTKSLGHFGPQFWAWTIHMTAARSKRRFHLEICWVTVNDMFSGFADINRGERMTLVRKWSFLLS